MSFKFFSYFMCVDALPASVHTMCMPGASRGQKRAPDPQELELQKDLSHHEGARD